MFLFRIVTGKFREIVEIFEEKQLKTFSLFYQLKRSLGAGASSKVSLKKCKVPDYKYTYRPLERNSLLISAS